MLLFHFFFNHTPSTVSYPLSLHDALPICSFWRGAIRTFWSYNRNFPFIFRCIFRLIVDPIVASVSLSSSHWRQKSERLSRSVTTELIGLDSRRSEEHTSELQSRGQLVCRLLL